jgi:RES domain-containing protein
LNVAGLPLDPPLTALAGKTYRCIASRFPPVDLYADLTSPEHFNQFHALEALTNPRLSDARSGGASPIDAAFSYIPAPQQGGRFNPDFAVYYCALEEVTAVAEAAFHRARFLRDSRTPATIVEARIVVADLEAKALADVRAPGEHFAALHSPDDYGPGQAFGRELHARDCEGIVYRSVRMAGGECVAAFTRHILRHPRQSKHLDLHWDGERIVNVVQKTLYRL